MPQIEIIPAIIPKNFIELGQKISLVEKYFEWAQIDVMDNVFVKNETWRDPTQLRDIVTKINIEVHLMVWEPEKTIQEWMASGVKRILVHFESTQGRLEILERIKRVGLEAGIVLNPETPPEFVEDFGVLTDVIQVMTVNPGWGGQEFLGDMLSKIRALRQRFPEKPIAVDGGINPETAKKAIQAGANRLIVGSYIYESGNVKGALERLKLATSNK